MYKTVRKTSTKCKVAIVTPQRSDVFLSLCFLYFSLCIFRGAKCHFVPFQCDIKVGEIAFVSLKEIPKSSKKLKLIVGAFG